MTTSNVAMIAKKSKSKTNTTPNHTNVPEKVKCRLCDYEDHILLEHLLEVHKVTEPASEYVDKYHAPLWSTYGLEKIKEQHSQDHEMQMLERPRQKVSLKDLFPNLPFEEDDTFKVFATRGEKTPILNEQYVFPAQPLVALLTKLEKKVRNRIWVAGPTGTGKTQFVLNAAAKLKAEVFRLNCDAHLKKSDVIGQWTLRTNAQGQNETFFQLGVLPQAMMQGVWLLADEFDTLRPDLANLFKPVLEDNPRLLIPEFGGKVIVAHPDFRFIATANTFGRGDDTGLYNSTMTQSRADMRRFNAFIKMDYLPEETEVQILKNMFSSKNASVDDREARAFVKVAGDIRAAFSAGRIDLPFSIDELINWVDTYCSSADLREAAKICFLNACAADVVVTIEAIINKYWGSSENEGPTAAALKTTDPNAGVTT